MKRVNAVIVGAGAAGGVVAKELAAAGLSVVLLERGKWYTSNDCRKDDLRNQRTTVLGNAFGPAGGRVSRKTGQESDHSRHCRDNRGGALGNPLKPYLLNWLREKGVVMKAGVTYDRITHDGLAVLTKEGGRQIIEADTIVTALPLRPNTELLKGLEGSAPEVYAIGDSREPNMIIDAIADGSRIARAV